MNENNKPDKDWRKNDARKVSLQGSVRSISCYLDFDTMQELEFLADHRALPIVELERRRQPRLVMGENQ